MFLAQGPLDKSQSVDMLERDYHAIDDRISASQLKVACESLAEFYARYVADEPLAAEEKKTTDQMVIGSVADAVITAGKPLRSMVAAYPTECFKANGSLQSSTHKSRVSFADACAAEGIEYILRESQVDQVRGIVESVRSSVFGPAIEEARCQNTILWTDDETELRMRCRPDFFVYGDRIKAFDLKVSTFVNPAAFRRQILNMRYWLQLEHYQRGICQHYRTGCDFYFLVVNRDPPHQISVHDLSEADVNRAGERWRWLTYAIREAYDSGDWTDGWSKSINTHTFGDWAFT